MPLLCSTLASEFSFLELSELKRELELQKKEIEDESGVSRNTVSSLIDQLVDLKILVIRIIELRMFLMILI